MPSRRRKPVIGELWLHPPRIRKSVFPNPEEFPGKKFAIIGANWLNGRVRSNFTLEQRKRFARKAFGEAIGCLREAMSAARKKGDKDEERRLQENFLHLQGYLQSI